MRHSFAMGSAKRSRPPPRAFETAIDRTIRRLRKRGRQESSLVAYRRQLERFAIMLRGHRCTDPAAIREQHLDAYEAWLRAEGFAEASCRQARDMALSFLRDQVVNGDIPAEPLAHVLPPWPTDRLRIVDVRERQVRKPKK